MTLKEALDKLVATDPNKSYRLSKNEGYTQENKKMQPYSATEYQIAALPPGGGCEIFHSETLEHALTQAIAHITPPSEIPTTANEE